MNIVALNDMLVVSDFDGTLAPIVTEPQQVQPARDAAVALEDLASKVRSLVLLTGRSRQSLEEVFPLELIPDVRVLCDYGTSEPEVNLRALSRFRDQLSYALLPDGVQVEEKTYSLAVHTRRTTNPSASLHSTYLALAPVAADLGLTVHRGRDVLDFSVSRTTKASTVERLVAEVEPLGIMMFGDDHSDIAAFRAIRIPHLTIGVLSEEVEEMEYVADVGLASPDEVVGFMREIATFTHVELNAPLFE